MDPILNPYQKASLSTALRIFEENLREADRWLDGDQTNGILYQRKLNMPVSQGLELKKKLSALLSEIALLAETFGLEKRVEDPASLISGQMSIAWANLIDLQASKLKRYGKVHADLTSELDPQIQRMAQAALELATLFGNQSYTPPSPDDEILFDI